MFETEGKSIKFVSYNGADGPENSYFCATDAEGQKIEIEMRCDGNGPMGLYDVVYVTQQSNETVTALPAHNCTEIQFK